MCKARSPKPGDVGGILLGGNGGPPPELVLQPGPADDRGGGELIGVQGLELLAL